MEPLLEALYNYALNTGLTAISSPMRTREEKTKPWCVSPGRS